MNKIKDFFLNTLGTVGLILYYIVMIVISILPFLFINLPLWVEIIIIAIVCYFPIFTPVIWIWGLVEAISGPQYWFSIVYYVVFVLYVILFLTTLFRKN